ncbi:solute:sodium symporter family transporter [Galbibacter pacificus]|uniref:Solute:sodium symporter family transporter n=1 Tax=Galbibacter pacificus TaxID=2996052 RepID=A0ABT6FMS0_9FLAO|nr:solute:sodium symporter family transporter [Galbibacter pacificus]MDG3581083.1 solute:sodium symporter family transporter [Galbibacter pacificus]MDG3584561.1 solute:sodium symporter family transporter [Galbibacter pacificus]
MNVVVFGSFVFCTLLIAIISYIKTRKDITRTTAGLFFANKENNFWIVGGALFLSNISANQLIGENESIYINNMSVMAWGVSSIFAMLLVAKFILPIYFKTNSMTIPDYLGKRYDGATKRLVSIIFLCSYLVNLLPAVLYGGAVAFTGMFDFMELPGMGYWQQIWLMVWVIGTIGSLYSIYGGLRAITISDSVLSIGLLLIGIAFPYYGFKVLGGGNFFDGLGILLSQHKEHLNSIGTSSDEIPFGTIFTGMLIMNVYYWGMEQYIVQQAMTAKNLKESQKGMALACLGKLLCPFLINIPGLIGVHLISRLDNTAEIFPKVVGETLPDILIGLTATVVLGAAITTFNAGLNSSSALFILNIYKPLQRKRGKRTSERDLTRKGKLFQIVVSLIAMFTAPFILFADSGFYTYLQQLSGMFCVPIFTIVILGFVSKKVSPLAAKSGAILFIICYVVANYVMEIRLHYLHLLGILFLLTSAWMLLLGALLPKNEIKIMPLQYSGNFQSWKYLNYSAILLIVLMIAVFLLFSPYGIA